MELLALNKLYYGAPILDSTVATKRIIKDGMVVAQGYDPIMITKTNTNGGKGDNNQD